MGHMVFFYYYNIPKATFYLLKGYYKYTSLRPRSSPCLHSPERRGLLGKYARTMEEDARANSEENGRIQREPGRHMMRVYDEDLLIY